MGENLSNEKKKPTISRKNFLIGAGSTAVAVGAFAAYDQLNKSGAKGKIVIIGAGAAGISMAARLSGMLSNPDITIIDGEEKHYYQPGFTLIGGGVYKLEDVTRKQVDLIPSDVKWVRENVAGVDPEKNYVITDKNNKIDYDYLVLVPGMQMNFELIEGVKRSELGQNGVHCIYDIHGAANTWLAIQEMGERGKGRMIFSDTHTKLKCGGAPKKINMLAERYLTKKGVRDNFEIELWSTMKNMFDVPIFRTRLEEIYAERNMPVRFEQRLQWVDVKAKRAGFQQHASENKEIVETSFDFLHIVPPMSAPSFVPESGLSRDDIVGGWASVDKGTMQHTKYKNIISLGDASNLPTSKTGAAIRMQAPIAARNLISIMEGKEPNVIYNGYSACPIVTEYGKVLMAEFDYDKTPTPSVPFIYPAQERRMWWMLKVYGLKDIYFHGMLNGLM